MAKDKEKRQGSKDAKDKETPKKAKGHPPLYATPEEMQKKIEEYFESCKPVMLRNDNGNIIIDKSGKPTIIAKPPTMPRLALWLGFKSIQSFADNAKRSSEFSDVVTRARTEVLAYNHERLYDRDGVQGAKAYLAGHDPEFKDTGMSAEDMQITIKVVK